MPMRTPNPSRGWLENSGPRSIQLRKRSTFPGVAAGGLAAFFSRARRASSACVAGTGCANTGAAIAMSASASHGSVFFM
jgi:hypothetical protein